MSRSYDPRMHAYDDQSRHAGVLYVLMIVIAVCFGGFLWQLYSAPEVPRITAQARPYKIEPPPAPPASETEMALRETTPMPAAESSPAEVEAPVVELNPQPDTPAMPHFSSNGRYVAQLAALQSEAAIDASWRRFVSRAPALFAGASMDVQRADLGPRGVYHRVRAGYFASSDDATLFCERIRQMGQDCIVAAR
ncbi:MAG: SPOR domain-containing protein [Hyphomonadaceae bacterium]|nr:SPOR domain-containing protein [Hyphomonadaceae bacterium]